MFDPLLNVRLVTIFVFVQRMAGQTTRFDGDT